jgi:hypothetical protein
MSLITLPTMKPIVLRFKHTNYIRQISPVSVPRGVLHRSPPQNAFHKICLMATGVRKEICNSTSLLTIVRDSTINVWICFIQLFVILCEHRKNLAFA